MSRLNYLSTVPADWRKATDSILAGIDLMLGDRPQQWRLTIDAPDDGSFFQVVLRGDHAGKEIVVAHRFEGTDRTIERIVSYFRAALGRVGVLEPLGP